VFWQPILSPHQRDFLEAVAAAFDGEVVLAVERELPPERIAQGWMALSHARVRVVDVSDGAAFAAESAHRDRDTLHVFSGFFSHPIVWRAFRRLADSDALLAVLSEAPEQGLFTGWLKRLRARVLVRRWAGRIAVVFAMGSLGREFFERVGFPPSKIAVAGYHLGVGESPWPDGVRWDDPAVRIVAAGQFIRRKGFDLLIDALADLPAGGWRCDLYGDGVLGERLRRRARRARVGDALQFHPALPNDRMRREIAGSDWAVVPSRHDGWGIVVNEALIAGTPVICSTGCGAADLIDDPIAGSVFPAGDAASLARLLRECAGGGRTPEDRRRRVHAHALRHSPAQAAAAFLARVAAADWAAADA
jgi:glycosyltransferase involved in cell wall biosynthesis